MSFYHVRVTVKGQRHDEVKTDIDEKTLEKQFLQPYRSGKPIVVGGRTITSDRISRIRISVSDWKASQLFPTLREEDRNSRVITLDGPTLEWRAAARAADVTDQFITGPPGEQPDAVERTAKSAVAVSAIDATGDMKSVFLIAGRDNEAAAALKSFLRALGLRVVEWEHAVARSGLPNPYVGDVVEIGLKMASAALVLLTPDDLVELRQDLLRDDDGPYEHALYGQGRPNVYYEAGFADAIGRERTVIVELGEVKPFSDVSGRNAVRYDGSAAKRNALAERLEAAGLAPDKHGSDWLTVGDVTQQMQQARESVQAARALRPSSSA